MSDFTAANHGSIYLLTPHSDAARYWVGEHLPPDAPRWGTGIAIEHRYAGPILEGIVEDGLAVDLGTGAWA